MSALNVLRAAPLCLFACLAFTQAIARPGEVDAAFGVDGIAPLLGVGSAQFNSAIAQTDGKVVLVGTSYAGTSRAIIVARLTLDGALDPSFSGDGMVTIPAGGFGAGLGVVQQADGKLLVAGAVSGPSSPLPTSMLLARFNPGGTLDPTFSGDGVATFSMPGVSLQATHLAVRPDGRIVVGGARIDYATSTSEAVLVQMSAAGAFDPTFGAAGVGAIRIEGGAAILAGLGVLSDGRLVTVGNVTIGSETRVGLTRLTATGQLDATYNGDGVAMPIVGTYEDEAERVFVHSDGHVIVTTRLPDYDETYGAILRIDANGELDATFGSGGRILRTGNLSALLVEPSGRMLVAGTHAWRSSAGDALLHGTVEALLPDGSPDESFANRGRVLYSAGSGMRFLPPSTMSLTAQPNGWMVLGPVGLIRLSSDGANGGTVSATSSMAPSIPRTNEQWREASYEVHRLHGASGALTVDYALQDGSASAGEDFVAASGRLSWADNDATSRTIRIEILNDALYEDIENFQLHFDLVEGDNARVVEPAPMEILSDDEQGGLGFAAFLSFVREDESVANVVVRRYTNTAGPLSVAYETRAGSASVADFRPVSGRLEWPAYDYSDRVISVAIVNDSEVEEREQFTVNLADASAGAQLGNASMTVGVNDDDTPASSGGNPLANTLVSFSEGAGQAILRVPRPGGDVSLSTGINFITTPNTASEGVDYAPASGSLTWAPGDVSVKTIAIDLLDDGIQEVDESLIVQYQLHSYPVTYNFGAYVHITDDEPQGAAPSVAFAASTVSAAESAGRANLMLTRSGNLASSRTATCTARTGSAVVTKDASVAGSSTVEWQPGDGSPKPIAIDIVNDAEDEIDEVVFVDCGMAGVAGVRATLTILDDDATPPGVVAPTGPTLGFAAPVYRFAEDEREVWVTLERRGDLGVGVSAALVIRAQSASAPGDFLERTEILNLSPDWPREFETRVLLNGDGLDEMDERILVALALLPGQAVTLSRSTAEIILEDDDDPLPTPPAVISVASAAYSANERQTSIAITVERTGSGAATVDWSTQSASATAGADFVGASGTLSWAAGDAQARNITIALTDDASDEADETFTVLLSNPSAGASLGASSATVEILDDDVAAPPPPPPGGGGNNGGSSASGGGGGGGGSMHPLLMLALLSLVGLRARTRRAHSRRWALISARNDARKISEVEWRRTA